MVFLSKEIDGFISEQSESRARWVVQLSNGETIYQDDDRPNVYPTSSWERLGIYVKENNLQIKSMRLQFRTHIEHVGCDADGFFFCRSAIGESGSTETQHFFIAGTLENGVLRVSKWRVPELSLVSESVRDVSQAGICLISN